MDIQAEKLQLIEKLAKLQDANMIQKIKDLLQEAMDKTVGYGPNGEAISQTNLINRAEEANKAISEGWVKPISQLREDVKNW